MCLTFFLSTLLDCLYFSVNSTCLPKSPACPCHWYRLAQSAPAPRAAVWTPSSSSFPSGALKDCGGHLETNQQLLLIRGRRLSRVRIVALREHHTWDSYLRIKCLSIAAKSLGGCGHTTQPCACTHTCTLFKLQRAPVFSGVKVSPWSEQGRTVNTPSEHPPWEPNRALKLLPCSPLKWKEKRARLLQLS